MLLLFLSVLFYLCVHESVYAYVCAFLFLVMFVHFTIFMLNIKNITYKEFSLTSRGFFLSKEEGKKNKTQ